MVSDTINEIEIETITETIVHRTDSFSNISYLHLAYFAGMGYFLLRFIKRIYNLRQAIVKHSFINTSNLLAFTFFRKIYINRNRLSDADYEKVFWHEKAHAQQLHSLDLMLAELLIIVQWFNPFAWMMKKSLAELHEYLADRHVLAQGVKSEQYKQLLYNQAMGIYPEYTNAFSYSLIKKRLIMVTRIKNFRRLALKVCCLMFAAALTVALFGLTNVKHEIPDANSESAEIRTDSFAQDEQNVVKEEPQVAKADVYDEELAKNAFTVVEKPAQFPGGDRALMEFIASEVKYPKEAQEKGIEGRVAVRFIVRTDGSVCNVEVVRGVDKLLDDESERVIKSMPKFIPGEQRGKPVNVYYTVPINFVLTKDEDKK